MRSPDPEPFVFGAVILAAGASSRMGRPKLLLPWADTTVLGHLLGQWEQAGAAQTAVVIAGNDELIPRELDRLKFSQTARVLNPEPARGMFSSIVCAARWPGWEPGLTHWALALGDQPHLPGSALSALAQCAREHRSHVCQPGRNGRPRHPVFLPKPIFQSLAPGTHGTLKEFLATQDVKLIEMNEPGLDLDLDTPADYAEARRRFG